MPSPEPPHVAQLPVPTGWLQVPVPDSEVQVMMCPREHTGEITPVAAISRHCLSRSPSGAHRERLHQVQERLCQDFSETFEWPVVEDRDVIDLGGHDVSYLRFTHQAAGHTLVTDLWSWLLGDEEWSTTGTVAIADYPTWCDVFEAIADAFDPEEVIRQQ